MHFWGRGFKFMLIKSQRKSESGFTLIELLIVIALIAIVAAVATPGIRGWKQSADLNADMRRLYGFFQKARMEAVKQNTDCAVVLDGKTFVSSIGADIIDSGTYSTGVTGSAFVGSFDRRGLISANTSITVQSENGSQHILRINTRGKMRIQ